VSEVADSLEKDNEPVVANVVEEVVVVLQVSEVADSLEKDNEPVVANVVEEVV